MNRSKSRPCEHRFYGPLFADFTMKNYENLQETLSFYGVHCHQPYYISSGNPIFKFPKAPFRIDFYALCLCIQGEIEVEIDMKQYQITQNGFLISAPSTIIKFLSTTADFRMQLLFFDKTFLLKNISNPFFIEKLSLFQNGSFSVVNSTEINSRKLSGLLKYLLETTQRQGQFIDDIIRSIIFNVLLEIAQIIGANQDENRVCSNDNMLFIKFKDLVQQQIAGRKEVQFFADQMAITNKYLIKVVRNASGKTPHEVIDEQLLKEACVLLSNPQLNLTEIAYQLNFSSVSAFGRFFKKHAISSLSAYRKNQNL